MAQWRLVITGCGTSHLNPPWGRPDLWSDDPKDQRRRSGAILLGPDEEVLLIDTGPDLAHQLRDPWKDWDGHSYPERCITRCDGVLSTHDHADHSHGTNDLRHLNRLMGGSGISIYGNQVHLDELCRMFPYCFGDPDNLYTLGSPALQTVALDDGVATAIAGLPVTALPVGHGPAGRVTCYKLGSQAAYVTDCKTMPEETRAHLRGLDLLIVNMLHEPEHSTHMNWVECSALIEDLQPRRAVLTHMGYSVRWAEWSRRLPEGIVMAYDGYECTFEAESP
jgi:phosphoribosyl 1,2-cyclic phosphate phosphodiesterase